jgi:hypothetical protein
VSRGNIETVFPAIEAGFASFGGLETAVLEASTSSLLAGATAPPGNYGRLVSAYRKSFDEPDERVEIAGMVEDVVEVGDFTVGRAVQPPGFRWSEHIRPIVGGDWCAVRHVGVVPSGRP